MEKLMDIRSATLMQSRTSSLQKTSDEGERKRSYIEELTLVIMDAYTPSNAPKTKIQASAMAVQWVNSLFWIDGEPVIPEDRLDDCLKRAFRDKTNDYAVSGYDLKNAWTKIHAEESAERAEDEERDQARRKIVHCTNRYQHEGDKDDGLAVYMIGYGGPEVTIPCAVCRPQAHAIRKSEVIAAMKKPPEAMSETLRKMQENPHRYAVDPKWLLSELMQAAGAQYRATMVQDEKDYAVVLYNKLARAAEYVRLNP